VFRNTGFEEWGVGKPIVCCASAHMVYIYSTNAAILKQSYGELNDRRA
jgi:hypothetical protein